MSQLIPRSVLFGNPERAGLSISPDGKYLAWLAPLDGVLNGWVAPREDFSKAKPVSKDQGRGVRNLSWARDSVHLIYHQDTKGDENWHVFVTSIDSDEGKDLTPFDGVQSRASGFSRHFPEEILVSSNRRRRDLMDYYRLNVISGEMTRVTENPRFVGILHDRRYTARLGTAMTEEGGMQVFAPAGDDWKLVDTIEPEDTMTGDTFGFSDDGTTLYLSESKGRNTAALFARDMETGEQTLLAEDEKSDVGGVILHPKTGLVQAVEFDYEKPRYIPLDPAIEPHLERLAGLARGSFGISSRSDDDRWWTVVYSPDNGSPSSWLYDSEAREAQQLFSYQPALEGQPLVPMHSAVGTARDGLDLVVYYSLPQGSDGNGAGIPKKALPMVLIPHGGPWARDYWGYNAEHQWLANRGYAVMSVNFRSSTGYGKKHVNAGNFQWGEAIMHDQLDAVQWAVDQGIAQKDKVAIMGGSFGGYSVLAGLSLFPDAYCCGVDIVGPSNLQTLLDSVPEYWKPMLTMMYTRVGDPRSDEGKAVLQAHSPLNHVDKITKPLLIAQGANDPRVKQAESDQIVAAMKDKGIPVSYVLYPDEGHGFARPVNRMSFYALAEAFLAQQLGGAVQPLTKEEKQSTMQILEGKKGLVQ